MNLSAGLARRDVDGCYRYHLLSRIGVGRPQYQRLIAAGCGRPMEPEGFEPSSPRRASRLSSDRNRISPGSPAG